MPSLSPGSVRTEFVEHQTTIRITTEFGPRTVATLVSSVKLETARSQVRRKWFERQDCGYDILGGNFYRFATYLFSAFVMEAGTKEGRRS